FSIVAIRGIVSQWHGKGVAMLNAQRDGGQQLLAALLMLVGFSAVVALYALARGLTWQFDDWINLKDLAGASSPDGLRAFLFGGVAGPSGRPVALLSFLPNYVDWPDNPWGFVQQS